MLKKLKTIKARDIYYKSPVMMQHVFTSAYGYKLKRERYRKIYKNTLKRYIRGNFDKELELVHFMKHLKENIDFYKDIDIDEENILDSFLKLPFTMKDDLRNELEERSYKKGIIRISRTSGTTGANLIVYDSEYDREERMAFLDYIKYQNGVKPFTKRASFTGQELSSPNHKNILWRYNFPMKQMLYSTRHLTSGNVRHVYESLARFKPVSLDGIPSSLHIVAKYMLRHNLTAGWGVKAIFPTAETLLPDVREDLEKAFQAPVIDQYSSAEGAPFIYSIPNGGYEIGHETGVVEFFRKDHHIYEMVVTSFINKATPIVRYKIGDLVEMESDMEYMNSFQHECQIKNIIGRGGDYLYASDGQKIRSIVVAWIADELEEVIDHIQFVQNEKDKVIINIVVADGFSEADELELRERSKRMLGEKTDVEFRYMDTIPKEKSGKVRFIINEVGEAVA